MQMKARKHTAARVSLVFISVVVAGLALASSALGAPAGTGPTELARYGFESAADSFPSIAPLPSLSNQDAETTAYWGRVSQDKYAGDFALWCAGTGVPKMTPAVWPNYPQGTRGAAEVALPQLADYYSASASMRYKMVSIGARDKFMLVWRFGQVSAEVEGVTTIMTAAAWHSSAFNLSDPTNHALSRVPATVGLEFKDHAEGATEVRTGTGPIVDEFVVTGYKYGPVRNLRGTSSGGGVSLTWAAPYGSVGSTTLETRPVAYRVWRADAGSNAWMELTTGGRLTTTSYVDSGGSLSQQYMVQAWDPATGAGRGERSTWPLPVTLSTPTANTTMKVNKTNTITGSVRPAHTSGGSLRLWAYRYSGTKVVQKLSFSVRVSDYGSGASTYLSLVKLTKKGSWKLFIKHSAHGDEAAATSKYTAKITVK